MAKHDDQVKALMAKVEERRAALGKRPSGVLATNGIFKINDKEHININTVSDVMVLVRLYKILLAELHFTGIAAQILEAPFDEKFFTFSGFTVEEWDADFRLKASIIRWNEKAKELDALQKKLDSLVSEDLRTETALADISKMLG